MLAYLDKTPNEIETPKSKKLIKVFLEEQLILITNKATKEEKNNNGTSVEIKKDEKVTPGINKNIKALNIDFL